MQIGESNDLSKYKNQTVKCKILREEQKLSRQLKLTIMESLEFFPGSTGRFK